MDAAAHLAATAALALAPLAFSSNPRVRLGVVAVHVALSVGWVLFGGCVLTQREAKDALPADAVPPSSQFEHGMYCVFRKPKVAQAALTAAAVAGLLLIAVRDRRTALRLVAAGLAASNAVQAARAWREVPADYCGRYGRRDASSLVALAAPLP